MRTTLQIVIAVSEADPSITDEELRLCIAALSSIKQLYQTSLSDLVQAIKDDKSINLIKMQSQFADSMRKRLWEAEDWLGPAHIPGSPEQRDLLAWGKKIYEEATGEKL